MSLWNPPPQGFIPLDGLRHFINRKHGLNLNDYHDLHHYSVEDYAFWLDLWQYIGVIYSVPPREVAAKGISDHNLSWFPGARLNYAENLLFYNDHTIACTAIDESGSFQDYTYSQLRVMVQEMVAALSVNGLKRDDTVAAIITNSITATVLFLATASIGAIFTSCAPDMGAKAILDRYRQIQPKFLFIETAVRYGGKTIDICSKAETIIRELSQTGLLCAILLPSRAIERSTQTIAGSLTLADFLASGDGRPLEFEQLPFDHPLCILYSSGTTGTPKCIVHSSGALLMKSKAEVSFFFGVTRHDTFFQYTTTSWMMWTLMHGALALGARLILYDGSPSYPEVSAFLRTIDAQRVSILCTSPRFLLDLFLTGTEPKKLAPFGALHSVIVGGAILTVPLHQWASRIFGPRVRVAIGMGGTDICSAFFVSPPVLPVHAGEMSAKNLGLKIQVFDEDGRNIEDSGELGELVCTRPHPSIPLFFWGDKDGQRLRNTYFSKYPGVWTQGDMVSVNPETKGIRVLGRSDGILNRSGIRFGSGEIYAVLEQFSYIEDSICIGQRRPHDTDERIVLFLKMRPSENLTDGRLQEIKAAIRSSLSARHLPDVIAVVKHIPYTFNGKKLEVDVKRIISGSKKKPGGSVGNPGAFDEYYQFYVQSKL